MFIWLEAIGKLLLSALLGGIIGWEREKQHKPAGFRTVMLVSLASTIY
ncbi:MAG: MgtC/SapB family protein, partial [Chloroflexi bacterium]|nr:MgtC/SapB family protein [Chloroflexota bacterium]